ncbi:hypothetical protein, partial [Staphylococcus epidermidis]|uniref:hypothetical protein n=1 Tax=Staphylococcus epidermidis TaxID=1282 RepID=UPI0016428959
DIGARLDRGRKSLEYIGNVRIKGFGNVEKGGKAEYECRKMGKICEKKMNELFGTKEIVEEDGGRGVRNWVREEEDVLISDSRFRDGE